MNVHCTNNRSVKYNFILRIILVSTFVLNVHRSLDTITKNNFVAIKTFTSSNITKESRGIFASDL